MSAKRKGGSAKTHPRIIEIQTGFVFPKGGKRKFTQGGKQEKQLNKLKWANPDMFDDYGDPEPEPPQNYVVNLQKIGAKIRETPQHKMFEFKLVPIDYETDQFNRLIGMAKGMEGKDIKVRKLVDVTGEEEVQDVEFQYTETLKFQLIGKTEIEVPYIENRLQHIKRAGFALLGELNRYRYSRSRKGLSEVKVIERVETIGDTEYRLYDYIEFERTETMYDTGVFYEADGSTIKLYDPFKRKYVTVDTRTIDSLDVLSTEDSYKDTARKIAKTSLDTDIFSFPNRYTVIGNDGVPVTGVNVIEFDMGNLLSVTRTANKRSSGTILKFQDDGTLQVGTRSGLYIVQHSAVVKKLPKPKKKPMDRKELTIPKFLNAKKGAFKDDLIRKYLKTALLSILSKLFGVAKEEKEEKEKGNKEEAVEEAKRKKEKEFPRKGSFFVEWNIYINEQFLQWKLSLLRDSFSLSNEVVDELKRDTRQDMLRNEGNTQLKIEKLEELLRNNTIFPALRGEMERALEMVKESHSNVSKKIESLLAKYGVKTPREFLDTVLKQQAVIYDECVFADNWFESVQCLEKKKEWVKLNEDKVNLLSFLEDKDTLKVEADKIGKLLSDNRLPEENRISMESQLLKLKRELMDIRTQALLDLLMSKYYIVTYKNFLLPDGTTLRGFIEQLSERNDLTTYEVALLAHLRKLSNERKIEIIRKYEKVRRSVPAPVDVPSKVVAALAYLYDKHKPVFGERDMYTGLGQFLPTRGEIESDLIKDVVSEGAKESFEDQLTTPSKQNEAFTINRESDILPGLYEKLQKAKKRNDLEDMILAFLQDRWNKGVVALSGDQFYALMYNFMLHNFQKVPESWIKSGLAVQRQNAGVELKLVEEEGIEAFMERQFRTLYADIRSFTQNYILQQKYDGFDEMYKRHVDAYYAEYMDRGMREMNERKELVEEFLQQYGDTLKDKYIMDVLTSMFSTGCLKLYKGFSDDIVVSDDDIFKGMEKDIEAILEGREIVDLDEDIFEEREKPKEFPRIERIKGEMAREDIRKFLADRVRELKRNMINLPPNRSAQLFVENYMSKGHTKDELIEYLRVVECDKDEVLDDVEIIKETKRRKIVENINEYEKRVYAKAKTYTDYVQDVVTFAIMANPDDPIGVYAKMFQAKLLSEMYKIEGVSKATMAHYLPELFMSEIDVSEGINILFTYVIEEIVETSSVLLSLIDVSKRREYSPTMTFENITELIRPYIRDVKEGCTNDASSKSLDSLIICAEGGKYYCLDKEDVIRSIRGSSIPTNPYTGKPFSSKLVSRIKKRYDVE